MASRGDAIGAEAATVTLTPVAVVDGALQAGPPIGGIDPAGPLPDLPLDVTTSQSCPGSPEPPGPPPVDTRPPDTVIQSGPSGTATSDTVTFTWTGNDDGTPSGGLVYSYQLERFDTAPTGFGPATIKTYTGLTDGATYTFSVQARDAAGNVDAIAARRTFRGGRTPAPRRRSPRRWC